VGGREAKCTHTVQYNTVYNERQQLPEIEHVILINFLERLSQELSISGTSSAHVVFARCVKLSSPVAKFLVTDWGDIVDSTEYICRVEMK
jgi:hypothetical protein